ncbi:hypothetical protein DMP23_20990 [Amycolatopsis sp. A1MSW2902]|uniref:asparagine synthase C-terminal domain-containing protein n=1 Tax=Amycolatopsis sp. A1MSW2902 TaxID=687413 RepID=UPI00307D4AE2
MIPDESAGFVLHGGDSGLHETGSVRPFETLGLADPPERTFITPPHGSWSLFLAVRGDGSWTLSNELCRIGVSSRELADGSSTRLPAGTRFTAREDGSWTSRPAVTEYEAATENPAATSEMTVEDAMTWVDQVLQHEAACLATRGQPVRLLLSGGVDSGLLAAYLSQADAEVSAYSVRTPWGHELDGARRTAEHVGVALDIVDVTAEQIAEEIPRCMRWLQSADPELVAVHVLATCAAYLAEAEGADLVTGLGSDLLNSRRETGMRAVSSRLADRVRAVSSSGLMATGEPAAGPRMVHPYWTPRTIPAQLAVPDRFKTSVQFDKYYLRRLAAEQLPSRIAFGAKVAIHEGSGLVGGMEAYLRTSPADHCARLWAQLVADAAGPERGQA